MRAASKRGGEGPTVGDSLGEAGYARKEWLKTCARRGGDSLDARRNKEEGGWKFKKKRSVKGGAERQAWFPVIMTGLRGRAEESCARPVSWLPHSETVMVMLPARSIPGVAIQRGGEMK